jgi:hypothetical protein
MSLLQVDELGALTAPVLLGAFDGWVNAGSAGTLVADHLTGEGRLVGRIDSDEIYDYRAVRPTVDFTDGVLSDIEYPEMQLHQIELGGRDLLVLTGPEPNWNWRRLGRDVATFAITVGVVEHVSVGGIPWAVPHTRPTSIIVTASQPEELPPDPYRPAGILQVPASFTSSLEAAVAGQGIPGHGFWARVPQYVGTAYLPAAVALLERVSTQLGVSVPFGDIVDQAAEQRARLDEIASGRPDVQAMIEQLESLVDSADVPGEELAAEIERFLQQQPGSGGLDDS